MSILVKTLNACQYLSKLPNGFDWYWQMLVLIPSFQYQTANLDQKVLNINSIYNPSIIPSHMVLAVKKQMLCKDSCQNCMMLLMGSSIHKLASVVIIRFLQSFRSVYLFLSLSNTNYKSLCLTIYMLMCHLSISLSINPFINVFYAWHWWCKPAPAVQQPIRVGKSATLPRLTLKWNSRQFSTFFISISLSII